MDMRSSNNGVIKGQKKFLGAEAKGKDLFVYPDYTELFITFLERSSQQALPGKLEAT